MAMASAEMAMASVKMAMAILTTVPLKVLSDQNKLDINVFNFENRIFYTVIPLHSLQK